MRKRIIIIVLLGVLLLFSGCSNMQLEMMQFLEEDDVRTDAEDILNAIENQDNKFIYDNYFSTIDEVNESDLNNGMQGIYDIYEGTKRSLQLYSVNVNSNVNSGGSSTVKTVVYLVKTDVKPYLLTLNYSKAADNEYNVHGIYVSIFLDYIVNDTFKDYDLKSWIYFIINIISYGIMILALILCFKTKIKLKPLWIILILLQIGITKTSFPNYFSTHFSVIKLFGTSSYLIYAHGGTITRVFFHVFAVIFLFVRKSLNKSYLHQEKIKKMREEESMNQIAGIHTEKPATDSGEEAKDE